MMKVHHYKPLYRMTVMCSLEEGRCQVLGFKLFLIVIYTCTLLHSLNLTATCLSIQCLFGGYTLPLWLAVDTNGWCSGDAVAVSLVKGDHDDELEWPFQGTITVQIY